MSEFDEGRRAGLLEAAIIAEMEDLTGEPPPFAKPSSIAVVLGTVRATAKSIAEKIRTAAIAGKETK